MQYLPGRGVVTEAAIPKEGPSGFFMKSTRTQLDWRRREIGVEPSAQHARKVSDSNFAAPAFVTLCLLGGRASGPPG